MFILYYVVFLWLCVGFDYIKTKPTYKKGPLNPVLSVLALFLTIQMCFL